MIRIIKGVFGYNDGKTIIPKTVKDEPFSCDKAIEKRLVETGVAEYVTEEEAKAETIETEDEVVKALYTDATSFNELKEIAKQQGATEEDLKPIKSKAQVKELIDKLLADKAEPTDETETEDEVVEDGEEAPVFDAVDGVEE